MDNIEKDLKRASLSLYGIITGRNRVKLEKLVGDRERWKDMQQHTWPDRPIGSLLDLTYSTKMGIIQK